MAKDKVHVVSLRFPRGLHEMAVQCADTINQSLTQFVIQAVAQRVRNWKHPVTGKPVARASSRGTPTPITQPRTENPVIVSITGLRLRH